MPTDVKDTALFKHLKDASPEYYGKSLELREAIAGWLEYIPQTFPNYTRHTIAHSEEIISQISKLLFDDSLDPVINLSAAEAYILVASAYLHDAGMVTSDREKQEILISEEWKAWVGEGGSAEKRWEEVQTLRGNQEIEESTRHFLADVQTRFLIAEFIRRSHHLRARDVITAHQAALGRFAFDDPILIRTISDVCVSHGLETHELEDRERFPEQRDVRGLPVNVRLMAILLRLGDLLDISHDRACPLLLNAASPLPADSLAHWSQYHRITHRLTVPGRIEITAECETQEEHRLLQDWCQWIVNEVQSARTLMATAARHADWQAPVSSLEGERPSIMIRPAEGSNYFFSKWTFDLDQEAIFQRLIYDVYESPVAFVRELIQNALDANRCQMYRDLREGGETPPESPTQVSEEWRARYPVRVALRTETTYNELLGVEEEQHVLSVEDCGIGMDEEIIQRYFLQVGRSYYTTEEFRRSYGFVPTSRFGLGFLSVFAVSDLVTVETYSVSSPSKDAIKLVLTGPRTYLLTERGSRTTSGTRIDVLLRKKMEPGSLIAVVAAWCRRVEFPIEVSDQAGSTTIIAEVPDDFVAEAPDLSTADARFVIRAFPIDRPGLEGELYVFARVSEDGEDWAEHTWNEAEYSRGHPTAIMPDWPSRLRCLHGISMGLHEHKSHEPAERIDVRGQIPRVPLSREPWLFELEESGIPRRIESRWEEILVDHLSSTPLSGSGDGWLYRQRLMDPFKGVSWTIRDSWTGGEYWTGGEFWTTMPATIRVFRGDEQKLVSLSELHEQPVIYTVVNNVPVGRHQSPEPRAMIGTADLAGDALLASDLDLMDDRFRQELFRELVPIAIDATNGIVLSWAMAKDRGEPFLHNKDFHVVDFPTSLQHCASLAIHNAIHSVYAAVLFNPIHPLVQWLVKAQSACDDERFGLSARSLRTLRQVLETPARFSGHELENLTDCLEAWSSMSGLPDELNPAGIELEKQMFQPGRTGWTFDSDA